MACWFFTSLAHTQEPSRNEWLKIATTGLFSSAFTISLMQVETKTCNWCRTNAFDESISKILIAKNSPLFDHMGDALVYGVLPMMAMGGIGLVSDSFPVFARDFLIVASTLAFTSLLTEVAKVSFARQRPEAALGYAPPNEQTNRSFWSGHTSFAFAMLSSTSTLVLMRKPSWGPYFVAISALVAGFIGYSRIAAAKHWATDVFMGMAIGTAAGVAMPFFLLDDSSPKMSFSGNSISLRFSW